MADECPRCGGTDFERGSLYSLHRPLFVPDKMKGRMVSLVGLDIRGRLCLGCGALEFSCDPKEAKEIIAPEA